MLFLSWFRSLCAVATSLLLLCAFTATAQNPLLIRDLSLRTDTTSYTLSRNTVQVQNEPSLYFYYRQDDETAELLVYPQDTRRGPSLRLVRSADFTLLDSLMAVDGGQYYRAKLRFKDLGATRYLRLTFRQAPDSAGQAAQTQTINLLPVTRTTLDFRPSDTELFIGEEKVFTLTSNYPKNIRLSPEWTKGQDIDYRLDQENGTLRLHVLPNALGTRLLTLRPQTERPFLTDNNRRVSYALPPIRQEFTVKATRLRFLSVDKKELTLDDASRMRGVELILDNGRTFDLKKTYRIESQEEAGGALIAELFTRQYLTNDRVLCWLRVYNLHRQTESYLYIKENDQAKYITNFNITPKTNITSVSVRHRGGDWNSNTTVNPGETVDVRLDGESLSRARFHFEDVQVIPSDSSIRSDASVVYRVQVPITIDKKRITIFNAGQPTGFGLPVREFQRPHPLDFVGVTFGEAPRPVTRLNGPILYDQTIRDVVFSFNSGAIDSEQQLYGKQYLTFEIRTQNAKGDLIEMRTVDNIVVCPDGSSVRAAFYQDKQCQVGNISLNNLLSARKTYDLDDWSKIIITIKHNQAQYQEAGFTQRLELVLQRRVKFDIDISFPAGLLTKQLNPKAGESNNYTAFSGISLATLAQFSFYNPNKINKLRPYKIGAGFVALNAFNLSQDANKSRDLGLVILGSVYPTRSDAKLTFPLYLGGGYLMNAGKAFFLFGPGIGVRL
ncbi:hypothetical protein HMJ29_19215 [Hymenobacter taeanensis]|uniref:Uncharacterized protein n=1 Tax=Hymenobacter taeanensis TaxID=2735321 RepID=A0A6M6BN53_9BACT|nr:MULTISPECIES: hypothetical protein [Hymenobacter]QJX48923.1 hypothetical protein HMJ29_19215 [Hymenobacter taeanensis]UOQ81563.1 hypothetical protein MUN83_01830 [Hymenobacter sp. 5414T-23]